MQFAFRCPRCEQTVRGELAPGAPQFRCGHCGGEIDIPADALSEGRLKRCVVCRSSDLFIRKDFPQRLGLALVVVGFLASTVAWYYYQILIAFGILFATAAIDVVLYLLMGEALGS